MNYKNILEYIFVPLNTQGFEKNSNIYKNVK